MNHNNSGLHCPKALGHQYHQSSHSMIVFTVAGQLKVGLKSRLQLRETSRLFLCLRLFRFRTTLFTLYTWWELARDSERHARISPTRMSPLTHAPHQLATIYCVCCARYWLWCCNHSTGSGSNRWSGWPPQSQVFTKKDRRKRMKTETAL